MVKKISQIKFELGLVIMVLFISAFLVNLNLNTSNFDTRAKAEDLGPYCDNPPDCCAKIESSGDPKECDWPWRKYCRPGQCNIPDGTNRERCGVAYKEVWPWGCVCKPAAGVTITPPAEPIIWDDYQGSCPLAATPTVALTSVPPTVIPTAVVIPTVLPTVIFPTSQPTEIPPTVSYPTNYVAPTSIPPTLYIYPTMTPIPTYTPTPTPKLFSLPDIFPPKEKVVSFIESIRTSLESFLSKVLP